MSSADVAQMAEDPATAWAAVTGNGKKKAEVRVSQLTAEQLKALPVSKQTEIDGWLKYQVVTAAARSGHDAGALMKMRWLLTIKDTGALKARLVIQGFTDPMLGKIATSSPTCSR